MSRSEMGTIVHLTRSQNTMTAANRRQAERCDHGIHLHSATNGWKNRHFLHYDEKVNPQ
ncbi:hypothetical protein [Roseinatronobacter bogoriensis]|uniref:hypothetical protein n=1 Tax=Roseinatronobacter bogoriensis TaxID=119542 RepID=UPI0012FDD35F|nr:MULTISPECIES: hypothetical protein [Rhodobaca]MBB4209848.1 hypothetical protein [Rhodobaca bogoriensis DSM 18756]